MKSPRDRTWTFQTSQMQPIDRKLGLSLCLSLCQYLCYLLVHSIQRNCITNRFPCSMHTLEIFFTWLWNLIIVKGVASSKKCGGKHRISEAWGRRGIPLLLSLFFLKKTFISKYSVDWPNIVCFNQSNTGLTINQLYAWTKQNIIVSYSESAAFALSQWVTFSFCNNWNWLITSNSSTAWFLTAMYGLRTSKWKAGVMSRRLRAHFAPELSSSPSPIQAFPYP